MKAVNLEGIDTIIFDLGMVIIDLDQKATTIAFKQLFGERYDESMRILNEKLHFEDYETGQISSKLFVDQIQEQLGESLQEAKITSAWNAMLKTIPDRRFRILKAAKARFRTFCLSNTNELHINFIYDYLRKEKQLANLDDYFEKVYLSHEVQMRKPNPEIFEFVLKQNQLDAAKTLFIDDTAGHLRGAEELGLRTYHLQAPETLEDILGHLAS